MQEREPRNRAFHWSTLFVRALYEEGIRHAVISPGSRSTALTLAFSVHSGFTKHVIIDERSAAYTALGIGKASGLPAVLVCTSGTAVANYLPSVIEARQAGVPLIIASADRPPQYRDVGASQTIDQLKIFGNYPVLFHEMGEPDTSERGEKRLQLAAVQAVHASMEIGGPAHLNFPFNKPFEPDTMLFSEIEIENEKQANRSSPRYKKEESSFSLGETFWSDLVSAEKPLIVVGPVAHSDKTDFVTRLARTLNAPILAEPGSNVPTSRHTIEGFDGFLRNDVNQKSLEPDLILRFGQQPVSKAVNEFLDRYRETMQISFTSPDRWTDGTLSSHKQILMRSTLEIPEVTGSATNSWLKTWKSTEKDFKAFREEHLHPTTPLSDGYIFSKVSKLMPKKSFTMLSNSYPVRDMSLFGDFDGKEMYVNRGAAGIDGITSTAIGLSISRQKAGVLFVGDIAFLHDSNALLNSKLVQNPLVVVVLNNGGGTIFRMLPVHSFRNKFTPYFETPQDVALAALCRGYKVNHTLVSKPEQLTPVFEQLISQNGLHVMECMTDAEESMKVRKALWDFSVGDTS